MSSDAIDATDCACAGSFAELISAGGYRSHRRFDFANRRQHARHGQSHPCDDPVERMARPMPAAWILPLSPSLAQRNGIGRREFLPNQEGPP